MAKIVSKPNYVVEDKASPPESQVARYRRLKQGGHLVNVAFLKGGGSVVTSVWHPKSERKSSNPAVQRKLDEIHKKAGHAKEALKRRAKRRRGGR